MDCLKEYIEDLKDDIEILESATSYIEEIVCSQKEVDSSLTNLQSYYKDTVNASDEFIREFHVLNEDAVETAVRMKANADGALLTAKTLLRQAVEAEASCPICHPQSDG